MADPPPQPPFPPAYITGTSGKLDATLTPLFIGKIRNNLTNTYVTSIDGVNVVGSPHRDDDTQVWKLYQFKEGFAWFSAKFHGWGIVATSNANGSKLGLAQNVAENGFWRRTEEKLPNTWRFTLVSELSVVDWDLQGGYAAPITPITIENPAPTPAQVWTTEPLPRELHATLAPVIVGKIRNLAADAFVDTDGKRVYGNPQVHVQEGIQDSSQTWRAIHIPGGLGLFSGSKRFEGKGIVVKSKEAGTLLELEYQVGPPNFGAWKLTKVENYGSDFTYRISPVGGSTDWDLKDGLREPDTPISILYPVESPKQLWVFEPEVHIPK